MAMSPDELTHWQAYHKVRPIGDEGEDYRAATLAWASLSAFGGKAEVLKLVPDWWGERDKPKEMTLAETVRWMQGLATRKGESDQ